MDFDMAWDLAMKRISWPHDTEQRHEWWGLLAEAREEWQQAYHREGQSNPAMRAVYALMAEAGVDSML